MPFTAGTLLCCPTTACVLIDSNASSSAETWDLIHHVTLIGFTESTTTPKLVTSSSNGGEISACGTIQRSGNLAIACHNGTGPGSTTFLCTNEVYGLRWAQDCDEIWNSGTGLPVDTPTGQYFEALVRITSVPVIYDIAGNQPIVTNYAFDIIEWVTSPACAVGSIST